MDTKMIVENVFRSKETDRNISVKKLILEQIKRKKAVSYKKGDNHE